MILAPKNYRSHFTSSADVSVSTFAYEGAHGKKPEGWGHWSFCPANMVSEDIRQTLTHTFQAVTYKAAERAAKREYAKKGITSIKVLS